MGSRHLQGTVFTRVKALCASGALKKKPVWFDVMEAFPPLVQMKLKDIPGEGRPPVIRYQEDEIRDIFYEKFPLLHKVPINFIEKENVTQTATHQNKSNAKSGQLPSIETVVSKYREFVAITNDNESAVSRTIDWVKNEEEMAKVKLSWEKEVEVSRQKNGELKGAAGKDAIDIADLFQLSRSRKQ